jgi:hypothetical protein
LDFFHSLDLHSLILPFFLPSFSSERVEMAKGQKPHKRRDFQWAEEPLDFPSRYGVKYVRGAEVFEYRDEDGVLLNDPTKYVDTFINPIIHAEFYFLLLPMKYILYFLYIAHDDATSEANPLNWMLNMIPFH